MGKDDIEADDELVGAIAQALRASKLSQKEVVEATGAARARVQALMGKTVKQVKPITTTNALLLTEIPEVRREVVNLLVGPKERIDEWKTLAIDLRKIFENDLSVARLLVRKLKKAKSVDALDKEFRFIDGHIESTENLKFQAEESGKQPEDKENTGTR